MLALAVRRQKRPDVLRVVVWQVRRVRAVAAGLLLVLVALILTKEMLYLRLLPCVPPVFPFARCVGGP